MAAWTEEERGRIAAADELEIASVRRDSTLRAPRPIWVVRAGYDLHVRAAYGPRSGWDGLAGDKPVAGLSRRRGEGRGGRECR